MSKKVFKWTGSYGRGGHLEGLFVSTDGEVKAAIGKLACFGEMLGKHSDVKEKLDERSFTALSEDPAVVAFVEEHGPFGTSPFNYITVECDDCGDNMRVDEVQDYWCPVCELRICYDCQKSDDHAECGVVEYEGQQPSAETEETDDESE